MYFASIIIPQAAYSYIAVGSFVISFLTFCVMVFGQRHTVKVDYVTQLQKRVELLESELEIEKARVFALEQKNSDLLKENLELLRRLASINIRNGT